MNAIILILINNSFLARTGERTISLFLGMAGAFKPCFFPCLQNLNFTGFRKILKKHDKNLETTRGAEWRVAEVEVAPFYTCKKINQLISETEVGRLAWALLLFWLAKKKIKSTGFWSLLVSGSVQAQVGWSSEQTCSSGKCPCLWQGVGTRSLGPFQPKLFHDTVISIVFCPLYSLYYHQDG